MNKPKISIVVPIYKVPEKFLRQCIESCVGQTLKDIEIILVDDGSPDDCGKICDEYADKDKRIKVIHKENGGLAAARNTGFENVGGEYHMYLDGDDWLDLETCEMLMKTLSKYDNIDIVFWKCVQELGEKSIIGKWEWSCTDKEHLYVEAECKELARNVLIYKSGISTAPCKLISTKYAKKYGIFHNKQLRQGAEGVEYSLRAFYYAENVLFVNAYWYHYLFNPESISKKINEKNTIYITDSLKEIEKDIIDFNSPNEFKEPLYQRTVYILLAMAMNTYFHPSNKDSLRLKVRKFKTVLKSYELYKDAIKNAPTVGMDMKRKLSLFFLRLNCIFMLDIIAKIKGFLLRKGIYNY